MQNTKAKQFHTADAMTISATEQATIDAAEAAEIEAAHREALAEDPMQTWAAAMRADSKALEAEAKKATP